MDYDFCAGTVTHVSRVSSIYGNSTEILTSHKMMFRVDGRPVEFGSAMNVSDGDHVSVAGVNKGGTLHAVALRNDSTGVIATKHIPPQFVIAGVTSLFLGAGCAACSTVGAIGAVASGSIVGLLALFPSLLTIAPGLICLYIHQQKRNEVLRAVEVLQRKPPSHFQH